MRKNLKLLYRSFDDELTETERRRLQEALANSAALRAKKLRIEKMRGSFTSLEFPSGKPFLAERVWNRISATEVVDPFWEFLFQNFKRSALATAVVLFILVGYHFSRNQGFAPEGGEIVIEDIIESDMYLALE
jgi:hypothetical protein